MGPIAAGTVVVVCEPTPLGPIAVPPLRYVPLHHGREPPWEDFPPKGLRLLGVDDDAVVVGDGLDGVHQAHHLGSARDASAASGALDGVGRRWGRSGVPGPNRVYRHVLRSLRIRTNCASSGTLVPPQGVVMPPLGDVNLVRWLLGRDWCPEPFAATGPIAAGADRRWARAGCWCRRRRRKRADAGCEPCARWADRCCGADRHGADAVGPEPMPLGSTRLRQGRFPSPLRSSASR